MGSHKVNVSHLQFVEDTLILAEGDCKNVKVLKLLIQCFEMACRFKVNWGKSHMLGISLSASECSHMIDILGCTDKGWSSEYLGLPLGGSHQNKSFWDPVLDRCRRKLSCWKANYLSFGGE